MKNANVNTIEEATPVMQEIVYKIKRGARLLASKVEANKAYLESRAKRKRDAVTAATFEGLVKRKLIVKKTQSKEFIIYGVSTASKN